MICSILGEVFIADVESKLLLVHSVQPVKDVGGRGPQFASLAHGDSKSWAEDIACGVAAAAVMTHHQALQGSTVQKLMRRWLSVGTLSCEFAPGSLHWRGSEGEAYSPAWTQPR